MRFLRCRSLAERSRRLPGWLHCGGVEPARRLIANEAADLGIDHSQLTTSRGWIGGDVASATTRRAGGIAPIECVLGDAYETLLRPDSP